MSKDPVDNTPPKCCKLVMEIAAFNAKFPTAKKGVPRELLSNDNESSILAGKRRSLIGNKKVDGKNMFYLLSKGREVVQKWFDRGYDGSKNNLGSKWLGRLRMYWGD